MTSFVSLMYHDVISDGAEFPRLSPSITSYFVEQTSFETQLRELSLRARCIGIEEIRNGGDEGRINGDFHPDNRRAVQITFDDGWLGSTEIAGPALESFGYSGMLFVTTDLIGCPGFVTERDLQRLPRDTFTVGSHGRTHRFLDRLPTGDVYEELHTSKCVLEDITGHEIDTLSVPGGALDGRVRCVANDVGYRYVFTSRVQRNSPQTNAADIGRVPVKRSTDMTTFRRYLNHNLLRERAKQQLKSYLRQLLGRQAYDQVRRRLLHESTGQCEMTDLTTPTAAVESVVETDIC